jgi:hypothetical protein
LAIASGAVASTVNGTWRVDSPVVVEVGGIPRDGGAGATDHDAIEVVVSHVATYDS